MKISTFYRQTLKEDYFSEIYRRGIIYPNDPEKTATANPEPGLFTLGEIGYIDDDGYVFITDRFSDMVVSGGVNIYPAEAEQILIDHPDIADVACIGIPHPDLGEELKALIIPTNSDTPPDMVRFPIGCERLTHYKCPRSYELVGTLLRAQWEDQQKKIAGCLYRWHIRLKNVSCWPLHDR